MKMDPMVTGLINAGGLGIAVAILYKLHLGALLAFREEMRLERDRNDINLGRLFTSVDRVVSAIEDGKCRGPFKD